MKVIVLSTQFFNFFILKNFITLNDYLPFEIYPEPEPLNC